MYDSLGTAIVTAIIMVGVFCFFLGGLIVWLAPKVWEWAKPFLQAIVA